MSQRHHIKAVIWKFWKKILYKKNSVFVLQYNSDTDGNDVFCIIISSQHVQDVVQNMLFYSQQSLKTYVKCTVQHICAFLVGTLIQVVTNVGYTSFCRSQWPRGLRRGSEATRPTGGMHVFQLCCQVEGSEMSWSLVQRSPTDCGASSCVI